MVDWKKLENFSFVVNFVARDLSLTMLDFNVDTAIPAGLLLSCRRFACFQGLTMWLTYLANCSFLSLDKHPIYFVKNTIIVLCYLHYFDSYFIISMFFSSIISIYAQMMKKNKVGTLKFIISLSEDTIPDI